MVARPESEPSAVFKPQQLRALIWSIVLATLGYLGFSLWGGWHEVVQAAGRIGVTGLVLVLCLSLANYALRFVRWHCYLASLGHAVPWRDNLGIYIAGFALTTTPGKMGEMLRSVFLARYGVRYSESIAAFFSERLSDLMAVIGLTLFGIASYPPGRPVVLVLVVGAVCVLLVLHRQTWLDRIKQLIDRRLRGRVADFASGIADVVLHSRQLYRWTPLAWGLALGSVAWAAEAFAFHLMTQWLGLELAWPITFFIYAFSMIIGAVSFLPGGLGGAELTMVTLLMLNRVEAPEAVALTVMIRVTTLWFAVLLGIGALLRHRHQ